MCDSCKKKEERGQCKTATTDGRGFFNVPVRMDTVEQGCPTHFNGQVEPDLTFRLGQLNLKIVTK